MSVRRQLPSYDQTLPRLTKYNRAVKDSEYIEEMIALLGPAGNLPPEVVLHTKRLRLIQYKLKAVEELATRSANLASRRVALSRVSEQ